MNNAICKNCRFINEMIWKYKLDYLGFHKCSCDTFDIATIKLMFLLCEYDTQTKKILQADVNASEEKRKLLNIEWEIFELNTDKEV